ncbi:MAG: alpha/beta hydrolase, partial [Myxococcales bacterium]|nr:alpha/beta hydrolase [Myxococcales bacterium]
PEATLATQGPSVIAEYHAFSLASDEIRAAGTFGPYPVRVLTATNHGWSAAQESLWTSMGASLAAEATNGEQLIVNGSGHFIQIDRPAVVVAAILASLPATSR